MAIDDDYEIEPDRDEDDRGVISERDYDFEDRLSREVPAWSELYDK